MKQTRKMNPNSLANLKNGPNAVKQKKMERDVKKMFEEATPDAVKFLIDTMKNTKASGRLRRECAVEILERHLGKTRQQTDVEVMGAISIVIGLEDDEPPIPVEAIRDEQDSRDKAEEKLLE